MPLPRLRWRERGPGALFPIGGILAEGGVKRLSWQGLRNGWVGLVVFFPAWVMVYHSRRRGGDVSYFEVTGTVTAKHDGWTDIGMARQILRWSEKYVCGWAKVSIKGGKELPPGFNPGSNPSF